MIAVCADYEYLILPFFVHTYCVIFLHPDLPPTILTLK
jgi:hypothetical protein